MLSFRQKLKLALYSVGFIASFTLYGILHEKILRGRYGDDLQEDGKIGERFRMPITFSALQSIFYALCAKVIIVLLGQPENETHQGYYALNAIFYILVKITIHFSMFWIPYSTQVIGRASKPLPVMIFGYILGGKTFKVQKIGFVVMIVAGVILFNFKGKYGEKDGEDPLLGNSLLLLSLFLDGLMGATVDRMRQASKPSALNLMFYLNLWGAGFLIIGVLVTGELPKFIDFVTKHPNIIQYFVFITLIGTVGQYVKSLLVSSFGPLVASITATVRKVFSLFGSVILFGNSLEIRQWCAAGLIFSVLFLEAFFNTKSNKNKNNGNKDEKRDENGNVEEEIVRESLLDIATVKKVDG